MRETQGVANLLAHHQISPRGRVVLPGVEIRTVDLGGALRDVATGGPDHTSCYELR